MSTLFDRKTKAIVVGRKSVSIQRMLDFDLLSDRPPSVAAIVDQSSAPEKVFYGSKEILIPAYKTLEEANSNHPAADVIVNFASLRSAGAVVHEGIDRGFRVIATIAEGVPERTAREWIVKARQTGTILIGPATVGAITAGAFRIGDTGGSSEHVLKSKLHRPGCVGYVGKSGGMSNEMYRLIAENSSGVVEGVAIGGDRFPGSHLLDHLLRYEENPDIAMLVILSEIGGREEEDIAQAMRDGRITKPLIAWVSGTSAESFPKDVQFGHAGAWAGSEAETANAKNTLLRDAGAHVPESFEGLGETIQSVYEKLLEHGTVTPSPEPIVPELSENRRHTTMQTTISSDVGAEASYGGTPISEYIKDGSLARTIAMLWWKTELPEPVLKYLEMILVTVADHGPAVAGAHNAIVAASAAKDPISALCSGLLTIGPRFGGAVDGAARVFHSALTREISAAELVDEMKEKGQRIPGIGHKLRSLHNPDTRVQTLLEFVKANFTDLPHTTLALETEKVTTAKKPNLILNVDGCIAATLLDVLFSHLSDDVKNSFFEAGYLNGLFTLGRTVGILGHIFDQKRLNAPLYRHPQEDILYGEGVLGQG